MHLHHDDHTATLLPNGKILIIGGDEIQDCKKAEIFDPKTSQFYLLKNMKIDMGDGYTATLLKDGRVLLVGGSTVHGYTKKAQVYDYSYDK